MNGEAIKYFFQGHSDRDVQRQTLAADFYMQASFL